jgi:hypothetical protein
MDWRPRGFIKTAAAQGVKPSGGRDLQNVAADGHDSGWHTLAEWRNRQTHEAYDYDRCVTVRLCFTADFRRFRLHYDVPACDNLTRFCDEISQGGNACRSTSFAQLAARI